MRQLQRVGNVRVVAAYVILQRAVARPVAQRLPASGNQTSSRHTELLFREEWPEALRLRQQCRVRHRCDCHQEKAVSAVLSLSVSSPPLPIWITRSEPVMREKRSLRRLSYSASVYYGSHSVIMGHSRSLLVIVGYCHSLLLLLFNRSHSNRSRQPCQQCCANRQLARNRAGLSFWPPSRLKPVSRYSVFGNFY